MDNLIMLWGTLKSRHGTHIDFDKDYVFCDKCCVHINICVFIVVKIKSVNSDRITTKLYTFYNI